MLVDHTDSGDRLAPDKYCCLDRNIISWQKISLPGMKYCCQPGNLVARKEILLVDHTDSEDGLATDKYCCRETNIFAS